MSLRETAESLNLGKASARALVEQAIAEIDQPSGEGRLTFVQVMAEQALAEADRFDQQRRSGESVPPFAGVPLAVKDLFDLQGQVTRAGSIVLDDQPEAEMDATAVARLRRAGFIVIGRTNMTEFAYSGLGLNHHFGTPAGAIDRESRRIPGGSSAGSAVAVADGMATIGLGTDTGGSCRIPAAFNGLVGFKPTATRVPLEGCFPLSYSLDSIGPIGRTVDCCALADTVLADDRATTDGFVSVNRSPLRPPERLRLGVLTDVGFESIDETVGTVIERSIAALANAGVTIKDAPFPELQDLISTNRSGTLIAAEAWANHRQMITARGSDYDQRVRVRIERGKDITTEQYIEVLKERDRLMKVAERRLQGFNAFLLPTVAIMPPTIESFETNNGDYYGQANVRALRNTSIANFLDTCAISIPTGPEPVGLMLIGRPHGDGALFDTARTVESVLQRNLANA